MRLQGLKIIHIILFTALSLSLLSCASTKISFSWVDPDNSKPYSHLLVIGVSESEQDRRAYESYFTEELASRGVDAVASYKLIKSNEEIDRDSISKAIEGLDIDGVIITHVLAVDEETIYRPSMDYTPVYGGSYYGGLYSYYPYVNTYVQRPGYYTTHDIYTIETNLYDIGTEELVWSARTRTFSPGSVDEVIEDLIGLLIADLADKKLISTK